MFSYWQDGKRAQQAIATGVESERTLRYMDVRSETGTLLGTIKLVTFPQLDVLGQPLMNCSIDVNDPDLRDKL